MTRLIGSSVEITGALHVDGALAVDGALTPNGINANSDVALLITGGGIIDYRGNFTSLQQLTLGNAVLILTSVATGDDPTETVYQNRVTTANNTVTTLHTFTLAQSKTYSFDVWVTARRTAGTGVGLANDGAGVHMNGTYKGMTGTATIVGTLTVVSSNLDASMAAVTMDVTGATVRVRVTGTTNNTITWHMTARSYVVGS